VLQRKVLGLYGQVLGLGLGHDDQVLGLGLEDLVLVNISAYTSPTFSKSLTAVSVSKLGCSGLVFVDPSAKINVSYTIL